MCKEAFMRRPPSSAHRTAHLLCPKAETSMIKLKYEQEHSQRGRRRKEGEKFREKKR
jgi:hypothetical protein